MYLVWKKEEFLLILYSVCGSVLANNIYLKTSLTRIVYKVKGPFCCAKLESKYS